jgi:hypothetical protein
MLCTECAGGLDQRRGSMGRGRVRLRATGRADEPFVVVCERCEKDIASAGTVEPSPPAGVGTLLPKFGLSPDGPRILQQQGR